MLDPPGPSADYRTERHGWQHGTRRCEPQPRIGNDGTCESLAVAKGTVRLGLGGAKRNRRG